MTKGELRILTGDLFDICGRLRAVDAGYYVCYNVPRARFEVHHDGQRGSSLALVVPYPELDERTVRLVRRTRAERADRLFAEAERENSDRMRKQMREQVQKAEQAAESAWGQRNR